MTLDMSPLPLQQGLNQCRPSSLSGICRDGGKSLLLQLARKTMLGVTCIVCIYIYVYIHIHIHIHMHAYGNIRIYIYTYVNLHMCVTIYMCIYAYIYIYISMLGMMEGESPNDRNPQNRGKALRYRASWHGCAEILGT